MSVALYDLIRDATTTTGAGTVTLTGSPLLGYRPFTGIVPTGHRCVIKIQALDSNGRPTDPWEICTSVYTTSGNTLTRGELRASSSGSRITFTAGTKRVSFVADAVQQRPQYFDYLRDFDGGDPTDSGDNATVIKNALQTVLDAGGGELFFPAGIYRLSGALQDTGAGGANAQIPLPQLGGANNATEGQRSLIIRGALPGPTSGGTLVTGLACVPTGQTIFKSTLSAGTGTLPSMIASKQLFSGQPNRNNIHLRVQDMVLQGYPGAPLSCLNLGNQQDVILADILIHTGSQNIAEMTPPAGSSYGVIFPQVNNCTLVKADGLIVWAFPTGYKLGELLQGGRFNAEGCAVALEVPFAYHANHITCMGAFECAYVIRATNDGDATLTIDTLDIENANGLVQSYMDAVYHIDDSNNRLYGTVNYHVVNGGVGVAMTAFVKNGGSHLLCLRKGPVEMPFASLPSGPVIGQLDNVSDCNTTTWGANAAGGGSSHVQVRWNGTNWTVVGK